MAERAFRWQRKWGQRKAVTSSPGQAVRGAGSTGDRPPAAVWLPDQVAIVRIVWPRRSGVANAQHVLLVGVAGSQSCHGVCRRNTRPPAPVAPRPCCWSSAPGHPARAAPRGDRICSKGWPQRNGWGGHHGPPLAMDLPVYSAATPMPRGRAKGLWTPYVKKWPSRVLRLRCPPARRHPGRGGTQRFQLRLRPEPVVLGDDDAVEAHLPGPADQDEGVHPAIRGMPGRVHVQVESHLQNPQNGARASRNAKPAS